LWLLGLYDALVTSGTKQMAVLTLKDLAHWEVKANYAVQFLIFEEFGISFLNFRFVLCICFLFIASSCSCACSCSCSCCTRCALIGSGLATLVGVIALTFF
jgi:hypothetical protein